MIEITVQDRNGEMVDLEIPEGISLSLMEVLKASGYDIAATCGGIALCATCHVKVSKGFEQLPSANEQEMDMLGMLPNTTQTSRLACQIRIGADLTGMEFSIMGEE